jgi:EmrB/QacA subfamily drug resistance transporter
MLPASLAIVVNAYPPERRGLPIGIWGAATVLFQAVAPLLGGALTGELDWPWIFAFGAAVGVLILLLILWAVPESKNSEAERRIDATGLGLLGGALVTLSLGVIQAPSWGWGSPQTVVLLAAAIVLFALFVAVERRAQAPLVNLAFFRQRNFTGATIVLFVLNFALIVALFFIPLLLQELLGYSATEAGALLLPLMGAMVVMLPLGGPISERVGPLAPILIGLSVTAIGFLLLSDLDRQTDYSSLWLPVALVGGGTGLSMTPMNVSAMNAVHSRESGSAGGVFMTLSGIGIGFGVAITGSIFNSRQLSETQSIAAERGIDLSEAKAENLDGLLSGASDAQRTLDEFSKGDQGTLEAVVREAFVLALGSAFRVGALVTIVGAVLATILIRRRPPADEVDAEAAGTSRVEPPG